MGVAKILSEDSDNEDNTPCSALSGAGMITRVSQQYKDSITTSMNNSDNELLSDSGEGILQTEEEEDNMYKKWTTKLNNIIKDERVN